MCNSFSETFTNALSHLLPHTSAYTAIVTPVMVSFYWLDPVCHEREEYLGVTQRFRVRVYGMVSYSHVVWVPRSGFRVRAWIWTR